MTLSCSRHGKLIYSQYLKLHPMYLSVARFILHITADDFTTAQCGSCLKPFLTDPVNKPDVRIYVHNHCPDALLTDSGREFICNGTLSGETLWSLESYQDRYIIRTYRHFNEDDQKFVVVASPDFSEFECYPVNRAVRAEDRTVAPLSFPLLSLILYYQTISHDAIFIHASGVIDGEKGRIFTGISGVGKTTMSRWWSQEGYRLVNDDRLMLRKHDGSWHIHNTPMMYPTPPASVRLHGIYLLKQAPDFNLAPVSPIQAISRVMSNCIIQGWKPEIIQHHLNVVSSVCDQAPVLELQNRPDPDVIPYIQAYDRKLDNIRV